MRNEIIENAKTDDRICFLGDVPREQFLSYEANCQLLINSRVAGADFTRYSFPSKNMEYLSSGVPMLGYKVEGISDEYDQYINYFENTTAESLEKSIEKIQSDYPYYKKKAKDAQEFILAQKSADAWGNKILNFLGSI